VTKNEIEKAVGILSGALTAIERAK
jgi:hypothetical protein